MRTISNLPEVALLNINIACDQNSAPVDVTLSSFLSSFLDDYELCE
jgi:hypothetical protein